MVGLSGKSLYIFHDLIMIAINSSCRCSGQFRIERNASKKRRREERHQEHDEEQEEESNEEIVSSASSVPSILPFGAINNNNGIVIKQEGVRNKKMKPSISAESQAFS